VAGYLNGFTCCEAEEEVENAATIDNDSLPRAKDIYNTNTMTFSFDFDFDCVSYFFVG